MKPLLTIAIPTYNRSSKLDNQIEWAFKALALYWDLCELIVSDNASTDDTPAVCKKWKEELSNHLIVFRQSTNLGLVGNVIFCVNQAQGKYVWTIGDDDSINLDALNSILNILESTLNIGLLHLNHRCVSGIDGSIVHEKFYPWQEDLYREDGRELVEACLKYRQGGLLFITANVLNTQLAKHSIESWQYNTENSAFTLYMPAWTASKSGMYVTSKNICDCTYYVSSWSNRSLFLSHYDYPLTYDKMKELGYSSELMNQLIRLPISSFGGLKGLVKFGFLNPDKLFSSISVYLQSIYTKKK